MFKRYHCVLQKDEKDCGAACILTILKQYEYDYSISKLREIIGTDKQGTNLFGIIKGLNHFNFKARAVRITDKKINESMIFPAIAHVIKNNRYHYIVIQKIEKDTIIISDPSIGVSKIHKEKFYSMWTGILVLVEKNENIKNIENSKNNFMKFLKIIRNQSSILYTIILISAISIILGILSSFYFKILVDYILRDKLKNTLNIMMSLVIVITIIKIIFEFIRNQLVLLLSQKLDDTILFGYYRHIIHLPLKFFSTRKTGEVISRFSDGINIRQVIAETIFTLTIDLIISIFSGLILLSINKILFFTSLLILFFYTVIIFIFKDFIKNKNYEVLEDNAILTSNIIENVKGIETIKAYNMEMNIENDTEIKFLKLLKSSYQRGSLYNMTNFISNLISHIGNYIIIWLGSLSVMKGEISLGELLVFIGILVYFLEPLKKIINLQSNIQIAIVAADRISEIIELEQECKEIKSKYEILNLKQDILIENLKFRYGTRELVLDEISLKIKNKEKVAFIGASGSGKTTLIKLLLKYYNFETGNIKIGNMSISDINTTDLRNKIAYVSQETFLFNKTIRENLFLNNNIIEEEVVYLLEKLNLLDFINSLPQKLDTVIDEDGYNLSGGQKQRLSILRALLKKPDIIILDEATSNLDSIVEKNIQNFIVELGITTIIIAHRLSTIKNCDNIFVFDKGKIVESGKHNELLELKSYYYNYWKELID